ncbi:MULTISPECIES: long-chain-fatty-acid--CoA ligase [unclassified Pseudonocardia]|uniref:long-chain-fatty-acid--CoA ligase n=1 Tax=unclassified Pseudonocardia TaxID=2619320 RepID=UPI00095F798B|nr:MULTISPECIES: long-chain-fatty-acid--CoA ligase [unclassified Pseudonocardia]MBN9098684.1 long-chain-fatty-acid--CoA ligase [Pseudonocardia sp.]OJY51996.1 MAG: AMP-dependent synthetase [Pseudonocardia sp. 73-21]
MTELLVTEFVERARRHHPRRAVASYEHGSEVLRYDYGAHAERVARLAGALRRLGVRPGDRVATLCWNHHRHLELYSAVPLAGAVLHTLNLRLSAEEIAYIVGHANDRLIIADADLMHLLDGVRPELGVLDSGATFEALVAEGPEWAGPPPRAESDLAVLCYTSGTTGRPKGVGYSHRGLYLHTFAACLADGHAISARDTVLHVVPMFHANGWGIPFAATMTGAAQVLPGPHPTVAEIAHIIERERVTYVGMVPTVAVDLLAHLRRHGGDTSSLRALVLGGSTPSIDLIRAWEELGVPVFQGWGMTEISPMATFTRDPDPPDDPDERFRRTQTQGTLLPGLRWRIVDDEGRELPWDGESAGELHVRGPWVAGSYYLGEAPDRFVDGWLRTGDVATIGTDGRLRIVDRTKDLIKSGGEWLSSVAIEQALLADPDVADAAVIAVAHERWQERPFAVAVLRDGAAATGEELRERLAERVPRWWLPEEIVLAESLPRTSVGKTDKRRLRAQFAGVTPTGKE